MEPRTAMLNSVSQCASSQLSFDVSSESVLLPMMELASPSDTQTSPPPTVATYRLRRPAQCCWDTSDATRSTRVIRAAHDAFQKWCFSTRHCGAMGQSKPSTALLIFDSEVLPSIELSAYCDALLAALDFCATPVIGLAALVLSRRYLHCTRTAPRPGIMHRLYAASFYLVLSSHSDLSVRPSYFATIAGLQQGEMQRLTREILRGVDWRTQVTASQIETLVTASDPRL